MLSHTQDPVVTIIYCHQPASRLWKGPARKDNVHIYWNKIVKLLLELVENCILSSQALMDVWRGGKISLLPEAEMGSDSHHFL